MFSFPPMALPMAFQMLVQSCSVPKGIPTLISQST
jgi:hypothetical protein